MPLRYDAPSAMWVFMVALLGLWLWNVISAWLIKAEAPALSGLGKAMGSLG